MTLLLILFTLLTTAAPGELITVTLEPTRDATLIQHPDGLLASGAGPAFFAGRTRSQSNPLRRGLIRFDVAGAIPATARPVEATLVLHASGGNDAPRTVRLHRVLADWGEGASSASGGAGVPAQPGDATWIHTFFDTDHWIAAGGQFVGHPAALCEVGGEGFWSWSGQGMLSDVRLWLAAPSRNFGWLLIGDETTRQTSKRFASREEPDASLRPLLEITYVLPGRPRVETRIP